ncbi:MAG: PqqD family protein [Prevotella sp.]|nr:PqqD family protein [Prevotella sp.]
MKTKKGFKLRTVCGEHIIVAEGIENIDFSRIINMNESAAYLWNKVQGTDFTADTLVDLILEEYEVDEATARRDIDQLLNDWREAGIIEA